MEDSVVGQGWQVGQRKEPRKMAGWGGRGWFLEPPSGRWMNISGGRARRTRKHPLPSELAGGEIPSYNAGKESPFLTMETSRTLTVWLNLRVP